LTPEDPDLRPDVPEHSYLRLKGTPEEKLAIMKARMERSDEEARARRGGRPLQPGDIGIEKSAMPSIYYLMRQKPDGSWERVPDDELPRYRDSEEERP
jgi:hypothetical protein